MRGRYGLDELGRHLGIVFIALVIVSIVSGVVASLVFDLTTVLWLGAVLNLVAIFVNWGSIAVLAWMFYRMLSRNIDKRRAENERYLRRRAKRHGGRRDEAAGAGPFGQDLFRGFRGQGGAPAYAYLNCPFCGQRMRVPQGKGKIAVKCPSCGEKTIYNS